MIQWMNNSSLILLWSNSILIHLHLQTSRWQPTDELVTPQISCIKFFLELFLGIYLNSKAKIKKMGVSVQLTGQWRYEVYVFALKSDFCVIYFILIFINCIW